MSLLATPSPAVAQHSPNGRDRAACRLRGAQVTRSFVDLGLSPLCESYVPVERLDEAEHFYPLHAYVCEECWLVQLREYVSAADIFTEYAYFSSYCDSWLAHARRDRF